MPDEYDVGRRVYVFCAGLTKVGLAADVQYRAATVERQCGHAVEIVFATPPMPTKDAFLVERMVHLRLAEHRQRGEWFNYSPHAAARCVRECYWECVERRLADAMQRRQQTELSLDA